MVADEHFWFAHSIRPTTQWMPNIERLEAVATSVIIGIGEASARQACDRTSRALGAPIGSEPVIFPGDHTGFVDEPAEFAAVLRDLRASGEPPPPGK